jgi:HlyD family secretion protein
MPQALDRQPVIDVHEVLFGSGGPQAEVRAPHRRSRKWLWALSPVVLLAGAAAWRASSAPAPPQYGVAQVRRGDVAKTISATGRLQALTTVQVGTQVSGTIAEIYADFNSQVRKGQVIARLDASQLQAQLTQASANLMGATASVQTAQAAVLSADASVQAAEANVDRLQAMVDDAERNLARARELVEAGVAPRRDLDTAQTAAAQAAAQKQQALAQVNQAKAQAQSARSQLNQAQAQAAQARASVDIASVNLERTVIKAPIDGVVVARNVDVGQTVAASLQAPTLFLIANDLTRMQVLADIDEADVGQLQPGALVRFTVDAYPSETFDGRISQVRLSPQTVQNVVTYTAVIDVANPESKLKPGMTANVNAVTAERRGVLTVPAAALRFRPEDAPAAEPARRAGAAVYRVNGNNLEKTPVRTGLSDGQQVEIVSGLSEGDSVAVPAQTGGKRGPAAAGARGGMFGMGGRRVR